jgi:hypothetical protein
MHRQIFVRVLACIISASLLMACDDVADFVEDEFGDDDSSEDFGEGGASDEDDVSAEESAEAEVESVVLSEGETQLRDFELPRPLFAPDSAWNQTALDAAVLPESEQQITTLYRVLLGDDSDTHPNVGYVISPFMFVDYDEWTVPVFRASNTEQQVLVCNYDGDLDWTNPKLPEASIDPGGPVTILAPAGVVRPSGPLGIESDGHMVLYNPDTFVEYDFWQASTARDGECASQGGGLPGTSIPEAGAVDFFDVRGPGANPEGYYSARAAGTPLLAGLLVPEDIEAGAIEHAMALAIPRPRNTNRMFPNDPNPEDIVYPASQVESDYFNTNDFAIAQGQRLRLRDAIVIASEPYGETYGITAATPIADLPVAPITRIFLEGLHNYGAYVVDNADSFGFYAEESHTANLRLSDDEVNVLIGEQPGTPLPAGLTKWQIVMEQLDEDLTRVPLASGGDAPWWEYEEIGRNPANATVGYSNFEVVAPATQP